MLHSLIEVKLFTALNSTLLIYKVSIAESTFEIYSELVLYTGKKDLLFVRDLLFYFEFEFRFLFSFNTKLIANAAHVLCYCLHILNF